MIKSNAARSKKYLLAVRALPCVICASPADDAHHIIGVGGMSGMGMKAPDICTMPVCREHHTQIHQNPEMWPDQWEHIVRTINRLFQVGVLRVA